MLLRRILIRFIWIHLVFRRPIPESEDRCGFFRRQYLARSGRSRSALLRLEPEHQRRQNTGMAVVG
jgi:hypothetical protein